MVPVLLALKWNWAECIGKPSPGLDAGGAQMLGAHLQGRWPCSHVDGSYPGRFLHVFSSNWLGLCLFAFFKISPQKLLPLRVLFLKIWQYLLGCVFVTDGQQLVVKGEPCQHVSFIWGKGFLPQPSAWSIMEVKSWELWTDSDAISASETVES